MKALCFKLFLLITVLVVSSGTFAQFDWTKDPNNPIFSGSGNGTWDKEVMYPMVVFNADSNRYEMWYCGYNGSLPLRIGFASSVDGINWTKYAGNPVLTPTAGTWDESSVELGMVLRENGQYKMWYHGRRNNIRQIGYATSPDGINWTKNTNPVLSAGSAAWEVGGVAWCSVLSNSGSYTMFYTAFEVTGTIIRIGRATSLDGINWQKDATNNPVLSNGAPGQWDDESVGTGLNCLKIDNTLYMWYTGWNSIGLTKSGLATSTNDGVTWTKYSGNPVLNLGPVGSWDASMVETGTVLLERSTFRMWYDAYGANVTDLWRIGIATSTLVVPVELTSFTAEPLDQKVILRWTTATELNNNGFEIQRRVTESDFATIGFVRGEGTTTNQKQYSYIDKDLADGKYFYRLKQVDYNGTYEYSNVIEVDVRSLNEYALEQNFPNPFNSTTTIGYVLREKSNAKLILLNVIGEEVAVLVNEEQDKGFHKIDFNASTLASGVYFYRLQAGDYTSVRKMILLK
jgi:predicted GH43/DUF377 family glycosyl hydrolase